jgi:succinyl-diaminopimelate desuccinylase
MPDLADRLARRTLELIDIPSESGDEAAICAHLLEVLRAGGVAVRDAGDTCLVAGDPAAPVVLAGHVDTVPAQGNRPGRIAEGAVHGLGAADMLGSIAVIVELLLDGAPARAVLFGREELPFGDSALTPLLAREPSLREAGLAVVMEPTGGAVHAGCVGNLNATWTFHGTAGHSARPWLADNAVHRAARGIAAVADVGVRDVVSDGLTFREVVSVTTVHGGIARNVVPGACVAQVNLRYAPGTSAQDAEAQLRALLEPHGTVELDGNAPSAPAALSAPLARAFAEGLEVAPKQAWTPVAEFAAAGVPALNFGPGEPRFAHRADEQVAIDALVAAHTTIRSFLCRA